MNAVELIGIVLLVVVLSGGGFVLGRAVERSSVRSAARLEDERRKGYAQGQEDQRLLDRPRPDVDPPRRP